MRGSGFAKFAFALLIAVAVAGLVWLAIWWLPTLFPEVPLPHASSTPSPGANSPSAEPPVSPQPTPSVVPASPTPTPSSGPERDTADIEVVFAGWIASKGALEVSGYTSTVVESGGTCTVTAQGTSGKVVASRDAFEDRTVTTCGTIDIPAEKLEDGSYDVTLQYRSAHYEGISATTKVQVKK